MAILELTEAAADKAKALLASSKQPNGALRVAVLNGGCSGMRYELLFDETLREGDAELEFFGLTVWGRTCTGQAIKLDCVIQGIALEAYGKAA